MCDRWKWVKEDKKTSESLNIDILNKLFSELSNLGVKLIILSGGEPLLRKDLKDIVNSIRSGKMEATIITNGTLIDVPMAEYLARSDASVIFSIDGVSETHDSIRGVKGAFERAMQGIATLARARKDGRYTNKIAINYTVQKDNVKDIIPCFNLANEIGVDIIEYNIVHGKPDFDCRIYK